MHGSSPLTRGTLRLVKSVQLADRFIPAHAGNTHSSRRRQKAIAVHPRSRGEHVTAAAAVAVISGSSPLTRGTQPPEFPPGDPPRFIPAHAGNTTHASSRNCAWTVHPRSRGEHFNRTQEHYMHSGSSPLTRGTPLARGLDHRLARFIPAHAGNTRSTTSRCPHTPVHPRSRGEHTMQSKYPTTAIGSSPLTRGTPGAGTPGLPDLRFIPAHAGNTRCSPSTRQPQSVHPRSRGEHVLSNGRIRYAVGSSPLTRGTRPAAPGRRRLFRFIPAHAGNTRRSRTSASDSPVHPRSRGEHALGVCQILAATGSSPLTRGTRHCARRTRLLRRFIPAHAGNTAWDSVFKAE